MFTFDAIFQICLNILCPRLSWTCWKGCWKGCQVSGHTQNLSTSSTLNKGGGEYLLCFAS